MKIRLVVLVGLVFSFVLPTFAEETNRTTDPRFTAQLGSLVNYLDDAINKNDAAAVAAIFMNDAVFVTNMGPNFGREAIENIMQACSRKLFSNNLTTVDQNAPYDHNGVIWASGGWSATIQGQNFGPIQTKGYWSMVLRNDMGRVNLYMVTQPNDKDR
jgi:uncharacterized protein (TIGR02246 family)